MKMRIAVLPGDGVGPEVTAAAVDVLRAVGERFGHAVDLTEHAIGRAAVEAVGEPLPAETLDGSLAADAVLLGAVGDPRADGEPAERRPETALLELRRRLDCWANLRPVRLRRALGAASPLRPEIVAGTDMVIVRELAGGLYYGPVARTHDGGGGASNTMAYRPAEVRRIARLAFELAEGRRGEVVSVDKANVLEVSRLWRETVDAVAEEFPEVACGHMLVDRAAMELVLRPAAFDVVLTSNLFGDILSDEAAGVVGSIGLLPSASIGGATGLYEPVHGSAPELAGGDRANPVGAIASVALMLRYAFGLDEEADAVERAVDAALDAGLRTEDLAGADATGEIVGTRAFGRAVSEAVVSGEGANVVPGERSRPEATRGSTWSRR